MGRRSRASAARALGEGRSARARAPRESIKKARSNRAEGPPKLAIMTGPSASSLSLYICLDLAALARERGASAHPPGAGLKELGNRPVRSDPTEQDSNFCKELQIKKLGRGALCALARKS